MSEKKHLTRKNLILIVLGVALLITAIAGGVVYAKYSQTTSAGELSVRVNPPAQSTVGPQTYDPDAIPFDTVHPVYPFG